MMTPRRSQPEPWNAQQRGVFVDRHRRCVKNVTGFGVTLTRRKFLGPEDEAAVVADLQSELDDKDPIPHGVYLRLLP